MLPRESNFFDGFEISKDVSFNRKNKKMTVFLRWPVISDQSLKNSTSIFIICILYKIEYNKPRLIHEPLLTLSTASHV